MLDQQDEAYPSTCTADVALSERKCGSVDATDWDDFVLACDGSFLGSWSVVRAERVRRRLRVFEFFVTPVGLTPVKVGQCALAIGRGRVQFVDRLHLKPGYLDLWDRCVGLVIERCGAATYHYGSPWNHEDRGPFTPPTSLVAQKIIDDPFQIDCIDFGRWADFAAYRRSVSENIRRDYKKAAESSARVVTRHGVAALRDLITFVRLRREVMLRNAEPYSSLADCWRHALKLACVGRHAFIATVRTPGRCHAAFFGVRFGNDVYYLGGGTEKNSQGFGSFLFMTLIEQWFTTQPGGKLYLGVQVACVDPSMHSRGNLLYRRKLRASSMKGAKFAVAVRARSTSIAV